MWWWILLGVLVLPEVVEASCVGPDDCDCGEKPDWAAVIVLGTSPQPGEDGGVVLLLWRARVRY